MGINFAFNATSDLAFIFIEGEDQLMSVAGDSATAASGILICLSFNTSNVANDRLPPAESPIINNELAAFLFLACAALRLARFNTHSGEEKRFFSGMPSPAAAAVLGSMVWVGYDNELGGLLYNYAALILCVVSALAMVSSVKYRSFKDFDLKGHMPFVALIGVVLIVALIAVDPPIFFLGLAITYLVSGPLLDGFESWRVSKADKSAGDSSGDA